MRKFPIIFFVILLTFPACQKDIPAFGWIQTPDKNSLYYEIIGNGEPILVIHGGPTLDHSYLRPHLDALSTDAKLIYYDQRAAGKSSFDLDSSTMNLAKLVEDIELLRKKLKFKKVHLLAHSFGGIQALSYAIKYPENVQSLILVSSSGPNANYLQAENVELASRMDSTFKIKRAALLNSKAAKNKEPAFVEDFLKFSFSIQFYDKKNLDKLNVSLPKDVYERREKLFLLSDDLSKYNLERELRQLKIPCLLVYGDDDPSTKISGQALNNVLHSSEFQIISECGHFPFIEKPQEFCDIILDFLKKN